MVRGWGDFLSPEISRRTLLKGIGGLAASTILGVSFAELKRYLSPDTTTVSVIKNTGGYSNKGLTRSIETSILSLEKKGRIFKEGESVLIKPSLVEARDPLECVTTHPKVVEGLVSALRHRGVEQIVIAEGSAHERDTEFLLEKTGFSRLIERLNLDFIDLNYADVVLKSVSSGLTLSEIYLPKILFDVDKIISVPKLKTHRWAGVTLSMKNLLGTVPGSVYGYPKNMLHWAGIPEVIVDLNNVIKTDFSLIDGIIGMEGQGPLEGRPKEMDILVAGTDSLAVDSTATRIMGFDPQKIPQLVYAYQNDIGRLLESEINTLGSSIGSVKTRFEPASQWRDWL